MSKRSKHQFFDENDNAKENFYLEFFNEIIERNVDNNLGQLMGVLSKKIIPYLEDAYLIYSNDPFIDIIMYKPEFRKYRFLKI